MKRLSRLPKAAFAILVSTLPAGAFAQDVQPQEGEAAATSASNSPETDGEIIVTARRRSESIQSVPVAVTALNGDQLRSSSVTSVQDLQLVTPSLTLQASNLAPTNLSVGMRGQGVTETLLTVDPSIGLYIDGVSLPNFVGAGVSTMVDIERVEVLKGPQGTLFGRNTTGGSINIISRQPTDRLEGEFSVRAGNYNYVSATAVLNVPIVTDRVALRLAGQYEIRDAFGTNLVTGRGLGGDLNGGFMRATLRADLTDRLQVVLRGDYTRSDTSSHAWNPRGILIGAPGSPAAATVVRLQTGAPTLAAAAALYLARPTGASFWDSENNLDNGRPLYPQTTPYSKLETYGFSGTVSLEISDWLELKSITSYRSIDRDTYYDFDGSGFDIITVRSPTQSTNFNQEFQLSGSAMSERLQFVVGAFYGAQDGTDGTQTRALTPINPALPNLTDGDVQNRTAAAFAQASYAFGGGLGITAGVRYTSDERGMISRNRAGPGGVQCNIPVALRVAGQCLGVFEASYDHVDYLLSIDYRASSDLFFYARTASGYRSGGWNLRAATIQAFEPFRPETVTDYEVGAKLDLFDRALRLNAAAYRSSYGAIQRSILVPVGTSAGITQVVQNAARGTVNGFEVEATSTPVEFLDLRASVSYIDARYDRYVDGTGRDLSYQQFPYTPKWTYNLMLAVKQDIASVRTRAQLDWSWRSQVSFNPEAVFDGRNGLPDYRGQGSYGLLNGRFTVFFDNQGIEASLWARNILDREYWVSGFAAETSLGFNSGVPGMPRTVGVEFRKRF